MLGKLCGKHPNSADAWFMQGTLLGSIGRFPAAVESLRRAATLQPGNALCQFNLGNALCSLGHYREASTAFRTASGLEPGKAEILLALAKAELGCGNTRNASLAYERYLQLRPDDAAAHGNLGACYFHLGELGKASKHYRTALGFKPEAGWYDGLGATLCQQGDRENAIKAHREAIRLQPANPRYRSNLLLSLNYLPGITAEQLLLEHRQWALAHAHDAHATPAFGNTPDPDRRLRIGYVSPDFRTHSVAYFFEPLLANHSKTRVETYCYACTPGRDETTLRLAGQADHWQDISGLADRDAANVIRTDAIDILVDLAGHTAGNRLPIFTEKTSPVQATWLGYPATTGLSTIDYRLVDRITDPDGNGVFCSEQLLRMPGCFLCYAPPGAHPAVAPGPAAHAGHVTLGSFNNLAKLNEDVIALWAMLLRELPDTRLLIKNPSLTDRSAADRLLKQFENHAIDTSRIALLGLAGSTMEHLDTYRHIDIGLDTFPYNGTTTTCEALFMGVPVITLSGNRHSGRVGASLLTASGCGELVATDADDYLAKVAMLAGDSSRLESYRTTLRDRLLASPLCDGAAFAAKFEDAIREMWRSWCRRQAS